MLHALKWSDRDDPSALTQRAASIVPLTIVTHERAAAVEFAQRLDEALGVEGEAKLAMPTEALPEKSPAPVAVSGVAMTAGTDGSDAMAVVEEAIEKDIGAKVDRDEVVDLLVVTLDS